MSTTCDPMFAAERAVVGAMLLGAEHVDEAAEMVADSDFIDNVSHRVFVACRRLAEDGRPISVMAVAEVLARDGTLAELAADPRDAVELLESLSESAGVGSELHHFAGQVRDAAVTRRIHAMAIELASTTRKPGRPVEDVLAEFESRLFELGQGLVEKSSGPIDAKALLRQAQHRIDERQTSGPTVSRGVTTGLDRLDELLGGLRPGTLTIVAARPGIGKSAMAAGFAVAAAKSGVSALFTSLEMSRDEIGDRLMAMVSGVSLSRIGGFEKLSSDEVSSLASVRIGGGRIWVDDRPGQTVARIASTARRSIRRHGVGLLIVDYLQLCHPENPRDPRHLQVGMVATRLKELARTAKVPVVALAQLNREIESRNDGKPKLSDLRDSGQIEADADTVILLHPQAAEATTPTQEIHALVEKNRHGPRGMVPLIYRRANVRFENAPSRW